MADILTGFGKALRDCRTRQGLSQSDVATAVGLSRTYLSRIEQGKAQNVSLRMAHQLAQYLGLGSAQLGLAGRFNVRGRPVEDASAQTETGAVETGEAETGEEGSRDRSTAAGEQEDGSAASAPLPTSLQTFATRAGLSVDDVQGIRHVRYRRHRPMSPREWRIIYAVVHAVLAPPAEPGEDDSPT